MAIDHIFLGVAAVRDMMIDADRFRRAVKARLKIT